MGWAENIFLFSHGVCGRLGQTYHFDKSVTNFYVHFDSFYFDTERVLESKLTLTFRTRAETCTLKDYEEWRLKNFSLNFLIDWKPLLTFYQVECQGFTMNNG